ncbi:Pre-mRNA-processing ATP-dependent RNA helicase PRP5 [Smittium culicis]|uniref:RNA helicase n=1 Tax=Smittium culicis TaxID=133412 RepID=A0A1R1XPB3_9FUNG|nr:Pre-mRNA-processing ATP-dependent RNA helicase PRP5 [Smittium culicis]
MSRDHSRFSSRSSASVKRRHSSRSRSKDLYDNIREPSANNNNNNRSRLYDDSPPINGDHSVSKKVREKKFDYNSLEVNPKRVKLNDSSPSLDRFSLLDVNQNENKNDPNCIINSFVSSQNPLNNNEAINNTPISPFGKAIQNNLSLSIDTLTPSRKDFKSATNTNFPATNGKTFTDNSLSNSPKIENNLTETEIKALKRRERLELWKKKKVNNEIDSNNSPAISPLPISDSNSLDISNEIDSPDKAQIRRMKAMLWVAKKKNSEDSQPEEISLQNSSPISSWSKVSPNDLASTNKPTSLQTNGNSSQSIRNKNFNSLKPSQFSSNSTQKKDSKIGFAKISFGIKNKANPSNINLGAAKPFPKKQIFGIKTNTNIFSNPLDKGIESPIKLKHVDVFDPSIDTQPSRIFNPSLPRHSGSLENALIPDSQPEAIVPNPSLDEDEIDSLDAYLQALDESVTENSKLENSENNISHNNGTNTSNGSKLSLSTNGAFSADADADADDGIPDNPEKILEMAARRIKKKDIISVDHSLILYENFKKEFYIEPTELQQMTDDDLEALREDLDGIKIRGQNCPKPAIKWTYFGLPSLCIQTIKRLDFKKPTPIQAQAIPAILQGRDVIGVAKTGSGKTLAFLLPMIRHIKAQRPLESMEGPIGMIMTPTRELAVQIARECRTFAKPLGLRTICAYGGSPIKEQIGEFKRGAEIVVCTPGRMIDLLSANSGRVTNLKRVTFLVLDEADRMFDMGFEPQVMKIVQNVRPSRQTLLFSATFPRQMEALARKILKKPLEISIGGRAIVSPDIEQKIQILDFDEKFINLLEVLGATYNENPDSIALVFVERQEAADNLFKDLLKKGYVCNSLHGGKDQADRDQTILDFKNGVFNLLVATSVAARGLDVKKLNLVVNYDCPNHLEDYIHRVGRTGRAGNKGTAVTFITRDQGRYAVEIVKVLQCSGVTVPTELQDLSNSFLESVKSGQVKYYNEGSSGGFGGKGLEKLDVDREAVKKIQRLTFGVEGDQDEDEDESALEFDDENPSQAVAKALTSEKKATKPKESIDPLVLAAMKAAQKIVKKFEENPGSPTKNSNPIKSALDEVNAEFGYVQGSQNVVSNDDIHSAEYFAEIEINDFPQKSRWKVTNRDTLAQITESTGAAITVRGIYIPIGKPFGSSAGSNNLITASANEGPAISALPKSSSSSSTSTQRASTNPERKLYLRIEGNSEIGVESAKAEIKRILAETTMQSIELENRQGTSNQSTGRYSVL